MLVRGWDTPCHHHKNIKRGSSGATRTHERDTTFYSLLAISQAHVRAASQEMFDSRDVSLVNRPVQKSRIVLPVTEVGLSKKTHVQEIKYEHTCMEGVESYEACTSTYARFIKCKINKQINTQIK